MARPLSVQLSPTAESGARKTPLAASIPEVRLVCADEEVLRIHAERNVASMANLQAIGNGPAKRLVGDAVGIAFLAKHLDPRVSDRAVHALLAPRHPDPAARFGHLLREPLDPLRNGEPLDAATC